MNHENAIPSPESDEREQLKSEIRNALKKFPEFTADIIQEFLQKIEDLELGLRERIGPQEELLCRERVQVLLNFLYNKKDARRLTRAIKEVGLPEVVKGLLKTLALQKEYTQAKQEYQDDLQEKMRLKFSSLRGVTTDKVHKLILSIDAVTHSAKVSLSNELIQPFLDIDNSELEQALDERGVDRVFPEIVNSFYAHMIRVIQKNN